jgi:hypothetical protein
LTDSTKKCIVKVTSDAVGNPTVEYLGTTNASAKNVTIPESVTIDEVVYKVTGIADNAFKNCTSLKKITISKYVTKIGKGAFQNCKKLKKITIKSMTLKKIGKNAFKNVNKNAVCQIPKGKKNEYKKMLKKAGLK